MSKFAFILILFSSIAHAKGDEILLDAGLGAFSTEGYSLSQVKFAKIGLQEDLWYSLKQRFNVGGWLDNRGQGRTSSAFGGYQIGFDVENDVFEASVFTGPSLISSTDVALGGILQFNETVFLGIRDKSGDTIGMAYNHFSSAGLESPNLGKDFMCLEVKFPLY